MRRGEGTTQDESGAARQAEGEEELRGMAGDESGGGSRSQVIQGLRDHSEESGFILRAA